VPDTEADTCRKFVVPRLQAAGWEGEPHSIAEQRTITDGRIIPVGKGFIRKSPKRVDYLLRYTRDFSLAVVEAKAAYKTAADGLQQAKQYAEMLGLKFAYASNGGEIIEFDYFTGLEKLRADYPTPDELWQRYRNGGKIPDDQTAARLLTPFNYTVGKGERYYQQIAINRTVEAILKGRRRLLTMSTGTVNRIYRMGSRFLTPNSLSSPSCNPVQIPLSSGGRQDEQDLQDGFPVPHARFFILSIL
jgi:type I restriction enzyme R subunit